MTARENSGVSHKHIVKHRTTKQWDPKNTITATTINSVSEQKQYLLITSKLSETLSYLIHDDGKLSGAVKMYCLKILQDQFAHPACSVPQPG